MRVQESILEILPLQCSRCLFTKAKSNRNNASVCHSDQISTPQKSYHSPFKYNWWRLDFVLSCSISHNGVRFLHSTLGDQPARGLRDEPAQFTSQLEPTRGELGFHSLTASTLGNGPPQGDVDDGCHGQNCKEGPPFSDTICDPG